MYRLNELSKIVSHLTKSLSLIVSCQCPYWYWVSLDILQKYIYKSRLKYENDMIQYVCISKQTITLSCTFDIEINHRWSWLLTKFVIDRDIKTSWKWYYHQASRDLLHWNRKDRLVFCRQQWRPENCVWLLLILIFFHLTIWESDFNWFWNNSLKALLTIRVENLLLWAV